MYFVDILVKQKHNSFMYNTIQILNTIKLRLYKFI